MGDDLETADFARDQGRDVLAATIDAYLAEV